ncbi:MAG: 1-deoxy-D-xylulose-5-phosphate reductoisomerase, partial [Oscillospiraceae bacterium]
HSAIFQCLQDKCSAPSLSKILLTASGGPFFGYTKEQLDNVTKEQALKHPNWTMGSKITIDSATLMNKGLELIEAVWLFNVKPKDVQILVHRQSIVHSMVEFSDSSVIAQLGVPDMRIPIQYSLTYPERMEGNAPKLDFFNVKPLTFAPADSDTFMCLKAAMLAIEKGGLYPCAVNGANERAVELFLSDKISFADIGKAVYSVISHFNFDHEYTLEEVFKIDKQAREYVDSLFSIR